MRPSNSKIDLIPIGEININWKPLERALQTHACNLVLKASHSDIMSLDKTPSSVVPLLITEGSKSLSEQQQGIANIFQARLLPYLLAPTMADGTLGIVEVVVGRNVISQSTFEEALALVRFIGQVAIDSAERKSSGFLEGVSHEVRSFLNGISGPIQLLKDKIEAKDQYDLYSMIDSSIARLVRFTFKTSLIGLLQQREYKAKQEEVNLFPLLQHTVVDLQEVKFSGKVNVNVEKPEFEPIAMGDADLLLQCFESILERIVLSYGNEQPLRVIFQGVDDNRFNCKIIFDNAATSQVNDGLVKQLNHDFSSDLGFLLGKQILDMHKVDFGYEIIDGGFVEFNLVFKRYRP